MHKGVCHHYRPTLAMDMDIEPEGNASTCFVSEFDTIEFKIVAVIRAMSALFSLVCAVGIIFIIVAHKKYVFFPQRLVLSLAITVVLRSISNALGRVDFDQERKLFDPYCFYFGGFLDLYTGWIELIAVFCIAANMFCEIILCLHFNNVKFTPFIITLLCPFLWCWIPYSLSRFGIQGPWCGISVHTESCGLSPVGFWLRFGLEQLPIFTIFLLGFVVIIVAILVKIQRKKKEWEGHRYDPKKEEAKRKLMKSICPLLFFPFLYLLLLTPRLVGDVYQSLSGERVFLFLWIFEAVFTPLAGGVLVIVCAFTTDLQTLKKLRKTNLRSLCIACFENCFKRCRRRERTNTVQVCDFELEGRFGDSLSGEHTRQTMYVRHQMEQMRKESVRQTNPTFDIIL